MKSGESLSFVSGQYDIFAILIPIAMRHDHDQVKIYNRYFRRFIMYNKFRLLLICLFYSSPRFRLEKFQRIIFVLITKPKQHATVQMSNH
jgi:hypothetical protein